MRSPCNSRLSAMLAIADIESRLVGKSSSRANARRGGIQFCRTIIALLLSCKVNDDSDAAAARRYSRSGELARAMNGCIFPSLTMRTRTSGSAARKRIPMAAYLCVTSLSEADKLIRESRAPCLYIVLCDSSLEERLAKARAQSCCTSSFVERESVTRPCTAPSSTMGIWFSGCSERFARRPALCRCRSSLSDDEHRSVGRRARASMIGAFNASCKER
mmetsp:Transcript_2122/g.3294  ORF Transcript_2122/g.3294 Transcript_2122/m.3294 type:complete len:218 (+) Transcript_2122:1513-2166(+)